MISASGITFLFLKLNNFNRMPKISIIIFIFGVITEALFKYFDIKYLTLLSYFIFYFLLYYSISKFPIKKVIGNVLLIWLVGIILDLISMLLASVACYIFKINLDIYYDLFSVILTVIIFLIFIGIGKCNKLRTILSKFINYFSEVRYFNYSLQIFSFFICILAICIFFDLNRLRVDSLLFIIIILSIIVFILLIRFRINDIENRKYLETLKENNDFYIKMDDENRIFKHNLMAKLSSIKSVSNKKAIALIDDFVIKTNKNVKYSKKIKEVPYGLNGIIYQKTYPYLESINFKITNKINFDIFNVFRPRRYNVLIEKLVVSLDNAIEASLNSKNKVVVINLYDDGDCIYIEIKNSFAQNIDMDNLGSLNYSTKGKKRGLGLFSILRNNEASLSVKVVNNYFISLISARKQK